LCWWLAFDISVTRCRREDLQFAKGGDVFQIEQVAAEGGQKEQLVDP
jgi:hypothetical protein